MRDGIMDARDRILGDREDRSSEKASIVDSEYRGGILWERSPHARNIEKSSRCYSLSQSYEIPRNLASPAVGTKARDEESFHQETRKKTVRVRTRSHTPPRWFPSAFRRLPQKWLWLA